eukprot:TRINITY_DN10030_c0_g2_i1.p1 TRINITY_DN10030_c0_g2~~TRINITY_DN10030_c0_g2_i1.p1  ORF type:complete len:938 (-),score=125.51 TRINITY_DN10030_c0_g2_i1:167-2980(-)
MLRESSPQQLSKSLPNASPKTGSSTSKQFWRTSSMGSLRGSRGEGSSPKPSMKESLWRSKLWGSGWGGLSSPTLGSTRGSERKLSHADEGSSASCSPQPRLLGGSGLVGLSKSAATAAALELEICDITGERPTRALVPACLRGSPSAGNANRGNPTSRHSANQLPADSWPFSREGNGNGSSSSSTAAALADRPSDASIKQREYQSNSASSFANFNSETSTFILDESTTSLPCMSQLSPIHAQTKTPTTSKRSLKSKFLDENSSPKSKNCDASHLVAEEFDRSLVEGSSNTKLPMLSPVMSRQSPNHDEESFFSPASSAQPSGLDLLGHPADGLSLLSHHSAMSPKFFGQTKSKSMSQLHDESVTHTSPHKPKFSSALTSGTLDDLSINSECSRTDKNASGSGLSLQRLDRNSSRPPLLKPRNASQSTTRLPNSRQSSLSRPSSSASLRSAVSGLSAASSGKPPAALKPTSRRPSLAMTQPLNTTQEEDLDAERVASEFERTLNSLKAKSTKRIVRRDRSRSGSNGPKSEASSRPSSQAGYAPDTATSRGPSRSGSRAGSRGSSTSSAARRGNASAGYGGGGKKGSGEQIRVWGDSNARKRSEYQGLQMQALKLLVNSRFEQKKPSSASGSRRQVPLPKGAQDSQQVDIRASLSADSLGEEVYFLVQGVLGRDNKVVFTKDAVTKASIQVTAAAVEAENSNEDTPAAAEAAITNEESAVKTVADAQESFVTQGGTEGMAEPPKPKGFDENNSALGDDACSISQKRSADSLQAEGDLMEMIVNVLQRLSRSHNMELTDVMGQVLWRYRRSEVLQQAKHKSAIESPLWVDDESNTRLVADVFKAVTAAEGGRMRRQQWLKICQYIQRNPVLRQRVRHGDADRLFHSMTMRNKDENRTISMSEYMTLLLQLTETCGVHPWMVFLAVGCHAEHLTEEAKKAD